MSASRTRPARSRLAAYAVALGLAPTLVLAGCAAQHPTRAADAPGAPRTPTFPSTPATPGDGGSGGSGGSQAAPGAETACDEVRAGIDAFNQGRYHLTVKHFRLAVPLAAKEDAAKGTTASHQLLAAVRYYAHLAPGRYAEAFASSPAFAKWQAVTLGQCESGSPGDGSSSGSSDGGGVHI